MDDQTTVSDALAEDGTDEASILCELVRAHDRGLACDRLQILRYLAGEIGVFRRVPARIVSAHGEPTIRCANDTIAVAVERRLLAYRGSEEWVVLGAAIAEGAPPLVATVTTLEYQHFVSWFSTFPMEDLLLFATRHYAVTNRQTLSALHERQYRMQWKASCHYIVQRPQCFTCGEDRPDHILH